MFFRKFSKIFHLSSMELSTFSSSIFGVPSNRRHPSSMPFFYFTYKGRDVYNVGFLYRFLRRAIDFIVALSTRKRAFFLFAYGPNYNSSTFKSLSLRCSQPFFSQRYIGGLLTNFRITRRKISSFSQMSRLPSAVLLFDPVENSSLILEAAKLGIPVVLFSDSNFNAQLASYPVPIAETRFMVLFLAHLFSNAILLGSYRSSSLLPPFLSYSGAKKSPIKVKTVTAAPSTRNPIFSNKKVQHYSDKTKFGYEKFASKKNIN